MSEVVDRVARALRAANDSHPEDGIPYEAMARAAVCVVQGDIDLRGKAIELSARFAMIGEDAMVSVARGELILDFLNSAKAPK